MELPSDACRLFHGRGGLFPGSESWSLDWYPPVLVATSFAAASDAELVALGDALATRWAQIGDGQPLNWVFQCRADGHADTRLMTGVVPEPHVVTEAGSRYKVQLLKGQNHGLFLDMAEGRRWVRDYVARHPKTFAFRVLNLFAYTCSFSVVALQAGARHVVNVDMSQGALATGQQNHRLNGIESGVSFLGHDIFKTWGKITRSGPYDLVVLDPPSYQRGSFVATKDYARLVRRLPELLAPGGHALVCLNAPELDTAFLQGHMQEQAPSLELVQRLPNPAAFADIAPERALKVLVYRMPEG
ncbi:ribosomal RNA large subunit methyltransferase K/L [Comamonadaceae bacterium OS-4]|nr:ribosomal RNA large subunit methyltransferase K/L [Comamonadaceae bacterium OS-4]